MLRLRQLRRLDTNSMQLATETKPGKKQGPVFDYTVDDEPQSTSEHTMTPTEILSNAGIDPATHYLVEIVGNTQKSYKDKPNEPIHMHEHMKFLSVATSSTPVS